MQQARNVKEYRAELREALDDAFLRKALDSFAVSYRIDREKAFAGKDLPGMIRTVAEAKDKALAHLDELYETFAANARKRGVQVHRAATADEANEIIARIAADENCTKIIKSKSMTAEETLLNHHLEAQGLAVTETDLGEWIIQLRHEGPSHMVLPAIHLSRGQVADLFGKVTGVAQESDVQKLVKVARKELRPRFVEADMGITGANFAVASQGVIGLCTNEGNARLTTTLPRVHVALVGLDKLVAGTTEALGIVRILPKNATAQNITSYVTFVGGTVECGAAPGRAKSMHVIFLDNGRSELAKDPICGKVLRCVRCGACAGVCPVYRLVGGHKMGHIYIGAVGLILTYFFHGRDKAKNLLQNCINCGACKTVCASGIDLPEIIQELRARINEEEGAPLASSLLAKVLADRKLFHTLLRFGKWAQKPLAAGPYIRHLPQMFQAGQGFRALPALAETPFRDLWPALQPLSSAGADSRGASTASPRLTPEPSPAGNVGPRVGLFAGCAGDFIYPQHLTAALKVFARRDCAVSFPQEQTCCGLPVQMMGERRAAEATAMQNLQAFLAEPVDYIVTLCASCASHMKHAYPRLLADLAPEAAVQSFCDKIIDFSSFVRDVAGIGPQDIKKNDEAVVYHAPCHLCRGLEVHEAPRDLLRLGAEYRPTAEEETCCGFGGSYSIKFPEISAGILDAKLSAYEAAKAGTLVTDCPGCVLQLGGGEETRGRTLRVEHMSEFLARRLK